MAKFTFFPKVHVQFWNFVPLLGEAIARELECKKSPCAPVWRRPCSGCPGPAPEMGTWEVTELVGLFPCGSSPGHAWYLRAIHRKGRETLLIRRHFNTWKNSTPASTARSVSMYLHQRSSPLKAALSYPNPASFLERSQMRVRKKEQPWIACQYLSL